MLFCFRWLFDRYNDLFGKQEEPDDVRTEEEVKEKPVEVKEMPVEVKEMPVEVKEKPIETKEIVKSMNTHFCLVSIP